MSMGFEPGCRCSSAGWLRLTVSVAASVDWGWFPAVDVVSVDSRCTLTQAIDVMLAHHFSALPVVDGSKLVGILTQTDVLKHVVRQGPVAS